jgi:hypothetical protein
VSGASQTVASQCHCGAVRFEAMPSDGMATARRCTCSYCQMCGAVVVSAAMGGMTIPAGNDALTSYRFNTRVAEHFFCDAASTRTISADQTRTNMA